MRSARYLALGAMLAVVAASLVGCSSSDSDNGDADKNDGGGVTTSAAESGTPVSVVLGDTEGVDGPQTMTVDPESVAAGAVTFTADNEGTIKHELIVLHTDTPYDQLEVTDGKISEADAVGEIHGFAAGETKSKTMELESGAYVLACNIKNHYGLGMRAPFTVT